MRQREERQGGTCLEGERVFGSETHILKKFTHFPEARGIEETRRVRYPLGDNCRKPSSNQPKQKKRFMYSCQRNIEGCVGFRYSLIQGPKQCPSSLPGQASFSGWLSLGTGPKTVQAPYHHLSSPSKKETSLWQAMLQPLIGLAWISLHPDPVPVGRRSRTWAFLMPGPVALG